MQWLRRLFSRHRRYDDLAISIQEHLDERTDELMEEGMSRKEAAQKARREFGDVTQIAERSREAWQWPTLESIWADVKFACLRLGKSPAFAATVILTLAIGIGANTAVFSVLNSVLIKPLPYPRAEELVGVWLTAPGAAGLANFSEGLPLSPSMYFTYAEQNRTFQSIGVWINGTANITGLAQPEQAHAALISDGVLQTLNVAPIAGRWLSQADQNPHGAKARMLSYGYWQRRFGGDPSAIGRNITIDAQSRQIIGVMPRGFRMVSADFDVILPLAFDRNKQILAGFGFQGIARLRPGVAIARADADVTRMLPIWMDSWSNGPGTNSHSYEKWRITPAIRPLKQEVIGNVGNLLWVVMGTLGVVMLIACANVANLMLVRTEGRQQELAIRVALGAGQARIARDLLTESVLLGFLGGVFGITIAYEGLLAACSRWTGRSAALERNLPRHPSAGLHRCPLVDIRTALRTHSSSEICRTANLRGSAGRCANGERNPGPPSFPQRSGCSPGSDGFGAAGERRIDDSHLPGIANHRAGIR